VQRIGSLSGLKVIALILLFCWHSSIPNPHVDIGARACEFFFVERELHRAVLSFILSRNHNNRGCEYVSIHRKAASRKLFPLEQEGG